MFSSRFIWDIEKNLLTEILEQKKANRETILDLTASNPTIAGFSYNETEILSALSKSQALVYQPDPRGLLTAREAVCSYYKSHHRTIDTDSIFLTASTSEAYSHLFKLLGDPGDVILVPQPGYPLLDFLAGLEMLSIVPYDSTYDETAGWRIDMDMLEASISKSAKAIVVVNPNNPTGAYLKPKELLGIHKICAKYHLALIVDEVFLDYSDTSDATAGSAIHQSDVLTFVLSGLSKTAGLPQVKLGWIAVCGPPELCSQAKEKLELIADTYLSVGSPVQHAAESLMAHRHPIQKQIRDRNGENERFLENALLKSPLSRKLIREGGWYVIIEMHDGIPDEERSVTLLEQHNVLVHPGYFYGFRQDGFLVVSLLTPIDIFQEGISRILRI